MQSIRLFSPLILFLLALAAGAGSRAQEASPLKARYAKHEYQIAMRDNIYRAKDDDFQKATQRIYRSAKFPTHLKISVLKP